MAQKINPSKLLPPSKATSALTVSTGSSLISKEKKTKISSSIKPIDVKKFALSKDVISDKKIDDVQDVNNKLIKIESIFRSDLVLSQKKAEESRKEEEKEDFSKEEKKLEAPKESRKFRLPSLYVPKMGFLDRIKRFLFFTSLGWIFTKFQDQLPKLVGLVKVIGSAYGFAENIFKFLLSSIVNFIDRGYTFYDKVRDLSKSIGGENAQKDFDRLTGKLNEYVGYVIIGGMALTSAITEFTKEVSNKNKNREGGDRSGNISQTPKGSKTRTPIRNRLVQRGGSSRGLGGRRLGSGQVENIAVYSKLEKNIFQRAGQMSRIASKKATQRIIGKQATRALLRATRGPLSRLPILGGLIEFGLSWALGEPVGKAAFRGIGTVLLGAVGSAIGSVVPVGGTMIGGFLGGWIGSEIASKLYEILFENKKPQKPGTQKHQSGGSVMRGDRQVGTAPKRTIKIQRKKPIKINPPKSQPGKNVGGEDNIKKLYPDTKGPKSLKEWLDSNEAGDYNSYLKHEKQKEKTAGKKANAYKALTSTAKTLKEIPLIGGIMGASVDIALGQKPDRRIYQSLSSGIHYLVESLASQKVNASISSLQRDISGLADGGYVPPSRQLKQNYDSSISDNLISKLIGPNIEQRVNEAIRNIQKEITKQSEGGEGRGGSGGRSGGGSGSESSSFGGGGSANVESINMSGLTPEDIDALGRMIEAESGNQSAAGKASVMNVILNRYRLARSGKGYLPRGKTKDNVTIRDILYDPKQFSPIADGRFSRTSSAAGKTALSQAISAGGNDPEKLKKILMDQYKLSEQDANYVVVSTAFSNPKSRSERPFRTREVTVGNHTFQESPNARLTVPGEKIESNVRSSPSQVQALSSGFRTGLKTGPSGRIGSGTEYHIDARFMYDVPLKDKIAMIDSMSAAHAQEGFVMEFSGKGVVGMRWNPNASPKEKEKLARMVLASHHIDRYPWQAFDYFAVRRSARDRNDKSAEGANIMAPRITGGTYEYGIDSEYGRHLIIRDKNGRVIFKLGHGNMDLASPKKIGKIFKMDEMPSSDDPLSQRQSEQKPINLSFSSVVQAQQRIRNMKPGDVVQFPGIGRVEKQGKDKKFYIGNKSVESSEFFYRIAHPPKKQSGGLIAPSKINRIIPNSYTSYENYKSSSQIIVQPIHISTPSSNISFKGKNRTIIFPIIVNSNSNINLERG